LPGELQGLRQTTDLWRGLGDREVSGKNRENALEEANMDLGEEGKGSGDFIAVDWEEAGVRADCGGWIAG